MTVPFENDHNVYILGAGFSAEAGLPLVANFMPRMREAMDWLRRQGRTTECDAIQRVLQFRLDAVGAAYRTRFDPDNIEELFSLAAASTSGQLDESMRWSMAATLDYAAKQRGTRKLRVLFGNETTARQPKGSGWEVVEPTSIALAGRWAGLIDEYPALCAALCGQLSPVEEDRKNTFISFNYDLVTDKALASAGYRIDYGIDPEFLRTSAHWIDDGSSPEETRVPLFKLHGSMNWVLDEGPQPLITTFDNYAEAVAGGRPPLMVPPTWRKSMGGQLEEVWQRALFALNTATRVVVIGFSMPETDQHFRYLLAAGLRSNISLQKIVFIDIDEERVRERAAEILHEDMERRGALDVRKQSAMGLIGAQWGALPNPMSVDAAGLVAIGRSLAPGIQIRSR